MRFNQLAIVSALLLSASFAQAREYQHGEGHGHYGKHEKEEKASYAYLRCNATNWSLADSNLLEQEGRNRYSLSFEVQQQWMVDAYDDCVLTVTDLKGQWTGETKDYVVAEDLARPGKRYKLVEAKDAGKASFKVDYKRLGSHDARVDLKRKSIRFDSDWDHNND